LNDPELSLRSYSIAPDWHSPIDFVANGANRDEGFTRARVRYLIETLSSTRKPVPLRVASVEILLNVSRYHDGSASRFQIDNEWLAGSADEIRSAAKAIFDDESQDNHLRSLCLRFLPVDQPAVAADVSQVYSRTGSEELRFAIEESFLELSDALYEGLKPPGGPMASVVVVAPQGGCVRASADHVALVGKYYQRKDFRDRFGSTGPAQFVLTNLRTHQRFIPKIKQLSGWGSVQNGEITFEISQPLDLPAGDYTLAPEFVRNGEVFSTGHSLAVEIRDTPRGRELSAK
jgi:hypothetical protein